MAVGAGAVGQAIAWEAASRKLSVNVVRNGSRGLLWLETLVEVDTPAGRVAYGPVEADDVPGLFEAGWLQGKPHALAHGLTEEIPYLKKQERLTFRSEEHTSELQSLMRISYAVFCLNKKTTTTIIQTMMKY